MGAWIEISKNGITFCVLSSVAPLVGAWIEISVDAKIELGVASLLSWERGLKYREDEKSCLWGKVAPLVGAWIEIPN